MLTTNQLTRTQSILNADISTKWTHIAVGTGITTQTLGDTALETEIDRNARQEISTVGNTVTVSMWIPSTDDNGSDITEVGVLDAASAGTLYERLVFTALSKTSSIEVWIDVKITNSCSIN